MDGHVITKFSRIYRLSFLLTHGAPLRALAQLLILILQILILIILIKHHLLSPLYQISSPFQGKKVYKPFCLKPPLPPSYYSSQINDRPC